MFRRPLAILSLAIAGAFYTRSADSVVNELIFDGTSLSGNGWTGPEMDFPNQLTRSLGGDWINWNFAVGGQTGAQMLADFATQVAPRFNRAAHQAVIFEMGTNDLGVEGVTAAEAERRYDAYFDLCVAAGWSPSVIFIRPLSPRFQITEDVRAEVNSYLLQKFPHNCIDPASEPRIYGLGAMVNRQFYADTVHPNATGAALEAEGIRKKMAMEGFLSAVLAVSSPGIGSIAGVIGQTYRIEAAASSDASSWETIAEVTLAHPEESWVDVNFTGQSPRFYRAIFVR